MPDFAGQGRIRWGDRTSVTVSNSGTANTKGAWAQVMAATPARAIWLLVTVRSAGASVGAFDLAIGAAGSEQILIADLFHRETQNGDSTVPYLFPVNIPAGTRIAARIQKNAAGGTGVVSVALGYGALDEPNGVGRHATAGVTTSGATSGTTVDPGATASTYGAWVELIAATAFPARWMNLYHNAIDGTLNADADGVFQIGIGAAGSEQLIVDGVQSTHGSAPRGMTPNSTHLPVAIPAGERVAVRCQLGSTAAGRNREVAMYLSG